MIECEVLKQVLSNGTVEDADGNTHDLHSELHPSSVAFMDELLESIAPNCIVEVGMAYGVSGLLFTHALARAGDGGKLISLDPNQSTDWKSIGKLNIERAGRSAFSRVIEEPSYLALPGLVREGVKADFCFIDGWHTFDYAMVDAYYCHRLLREGGILCLDDCGLPSINRVADWMLANRHYEEITPPSDQPYKRSTLIKTFGAWMLRKPVPVPVRFLKKLDDWEPVSE
jgi:predicted O-methyltransferase YrrM